MSEKKMVKGRFGHYDVLKMKLVYLVDIDVDILENLCSIHRDQYDESETYEEDLVDDAQGCDDCTDLRNQEAFKQSDYVEITKFDLPHDVDIA